MTELLAAVGDLLGERVELVEYLSEEDRRNTIARVRVAGGAVAGQSLIIKQTVGFDSSDADDGIRRRFYQEAITAMFLTRIAPGEHAPRCHGVDPQRGLMIFDDLGNASDLAGPLLGDDSSSAHSALLAYVRRLGAVHAVAAGRLESWDEVAAELDAPAELRRDHALLAHAQALDDGVRSLGEQLQKVGLPGIDDETRGEVETVRAAIIQPGPFTTLVHRDSCPDNVIINAADAQLIDFEFSGPGHALLDGLYPQVPFPTCWCCNRLPDKIVDELAAVYRAELIKGVPSAAADEIYDEAVGQVMAYWLLIMFAGPLANALGESRTWGIASTRSRVLSRLEVFIGHAGRTGTLPRLRELAEGMLAELDRRWTDDGPLSIYPAFRTQPS